MCANSPRTTSKSPPPPSPPPLAHSHTHTRSKHGQTNICDMQGWQSEWEACARDESLRMCVMS